MGSWGDFGMFNLFKKKKEISASESTMYTYNDISNNVYQIPIQPNMQDNENVKNSVHESSTQPINNFNCKMNRLMELVGIAIETWAKEYHMENLPKRILFEQALDAMQTIELAVNSKNTNRKE